jgi:hypothetical protein
MQMHRYEAYQRAGCEFAKNDPNGLQRMVWVETKGKMCDTGCAKFANGNCEAYKVLEKK